MKCGNCGLLQDDVSDVKTINVCESCDAAGWVLVGAGQVVRKNPSQYKAGAFRAKPPAAAKKPAPKKTAPKKAAGSRKRR